MEFGRSSQISTDYRDRKVPLNWEMRLFVHVVLLDKTPPTVPPLLYQLQNQCTEFSHFSKESLILLGEVVEVDKKKKQIVLTNKNVVAYDHLVIATGTKESSAEEEFAAGLKALTDALKMQETVPSSFSAISVESGPFHHQSKHHCEVGFDERIDPVCRMVHPHIGMTKKSLEVWDIHSNHKRLYEVQL